MRPGGQVHRWPTQRPAAKVVPVERLHVGDGPHCACGDPRRVHLPIDWPGPLAAPWEPDDDDHQRLRPVPSPPVEPPVVPPTRLRPVAMHRELDERRANLEATLALLMVVLLFVAIARSADVRRLSDRAVETVGRSITAIDDIGLRLRLAYAELLSRAGAP